MKLFQQRGRNHTTVATCAMHVKIYSHRGWPLIRILQIIQGKLTASRVCPSAYSLGLHVHTTSFSSNGISIANSSCSTPTIKSIGSPIFFQLGKPPSEPRTLSTNSCEPDDRFFFFPAQQPVPSLWNGHVACPLQSSSSPIKM